VVAVAAVLVGSEAAGGAGAPREHAGQVPQGDGFGDPVGDLVGLDVDVVERAGAREGTSAVRRPRRLSKPHDRRRRS